MRIFKTAEGLQRFLDGQKAMGKTTGFVPTMGALHGGHLSLVDAAKKGSRLTVCSIFVNPTQFNNPEDFRHYPITIEKDIEALLKSDCDVLFLPPVFEVYPPQYQKKHYGLGALETVLEGAHRPGHFQGVCQVMDRLLQIVAPHHLYMGQKDYQQCLVVQRLLELTRRSNMKLHIAPTLREKDGLAMSSRNLRLNDEARKKAPQIFEQLQWIKANLPSDAFDDLEKEAAQCLTASGFAVDYVAIRNGVDLGAPADNKPKVVLAAASVGGIRLIDNLALY